MRPRIGYGAVVRLDNFVALSAVSVSTQPTTVHKHLSTGRVCRASGGALRAIGDGIAVVQGSPELPRTCRFRQNNHFFYLTGVEAPRAIALLDGRTEQDDVVPGSGQ